VNIDVNKMLIIKVSRETIRFMHNKPLHHINIGKIGEKIALNFLRNKKYKILDINLRNKLGEIDILASYNKSMIDFNQDEEKTLNIDDLYKTLINGKINDKINDILYDKNKGHFLWQSFKNNFKNLFIKILFDRFVNIDCSKENLVFVEVKTIFQSDNRKNLMPEENLTYFKKQKLLKAAKSYLLSHKLFLDINWQFDLIAIILDANQNKVILRHYKNVNIVYNKM